jgi:OmpA-OmpF porin, OOP family
MHRRSLHLALGAMMLAAAGVAPVQAGDLRNPVPTAEQLINALTPSSEAREDQPRSRGVRPTGAGMSAQPGPPKPPAVNLDVKFQYNSAELMPEARRVLDQLGAAIRAPQLEKYSFVLEGHTDSKGSDEYNMRLSERRAQSVRDYLVTNHGIRSERLRPVGKGETEPLDSQRPESGVNRRVQVVNLGS